MPKKRILITGSAGFIGYHTARALNYRGDFVVGLDDFNPYYSVSLKRDRARELEKRGVETVEGTISDGKLLNSLIEKYKISHWIHLAAQAGVRSSLIHPKSHIDTNIVGFLHVLETLRNHPHIPLTYASSSSVYGSNEKVPFSEKDRVDEPASLYAVTKKCGEDMALVYHNLFGLKVTGLRFFTVYGEWGRPDMAYFSFVDKILKGEEIPLFNHGQMERDFTYIDDIVDGTIGAVDLESPLEIFNLGNSYPVPLSRFVEIIEESSRKKAKIRNLPMQPGDVVRTCADISHSQEKLNFSPKTTLEVGIPRFIDWFQTYYNP